MYDIVKIGLNQKVPSAALNRIGELARAGLAAETRQMLVADLAWADFTCTYTSGSFVLNVSGGDLYKDGLQYRTLAATPLDMIADAPPSEGLKRVVSIVAYALPAKDEAPENREFATVITPATNTAPAVYQSETKQHNTLNRQVAVVGKRLGDFAPSPPPPPTLTPDLCEIAQVVLGIGGIEGVVMVEANRAPNLSRERRRVDAIAGFVAGQGARLDTLDKNLGALAARIPPPLADALIRQITRNLSNLNATTRVRTGDLSYQIEHGLDLSMTDNTYTGYAASVEDGIRFPYVASKEAPLTLFTPGDQNVKMVAGLMLAAHDEEPRIDVTGMDGSLSISSQVNTVVTARKVQIPRTLVRYGSFPVCENSQFWADGSFDARNQLFTRFGETYPILSQSTHANGHIIYRLQRTWVDKWIETRWDDVFTPIGLNGAIRGQTFRVPDFGYLTSIDLPFVTKDAAHGITLLLCETVGGVPDLTRVLEQSDLTASSVVADTAGKKRTKFSFRPALVDPGKLYSWVTVTRGNYALATVKNNKFAEGTSFLSTDGGKFFQGDPIIDFPFTANFARFKSPRVEIRLNDVSNVNGDVISALRFMYGSVVPAGTRIVHMARREGGDWQTLGEVVADGQPSEPGAGPFDAAPLPLSVQQMIVLVGTTTLMPAIDLTQAWVTALKLGTVLKHVTLPINFGTNCNRAEVEVTLDGPFNPANHGTDCQLIVGGVSVPWSGKTPIDDPQKPGRRKYRYNFSFASASSARIELTGTLTSNLAPYFVEERFMRAWSV